MLWIGGDSLSKTQAGEKALRHQEPVVGQPACDQALAMAGLIVVGPIQRPIAFEGGNVQRSPRQPIEKLFQGGKGHLRRMDLPARVRCEVRVPDRCKPLHRFVLFMDIGRQLGLGNEIVEPVVVNELGRNVMCRVIVLPLFRELEPALIRHRIQWVDQ